MNKDFRIGSTEVLPKKTPLMPSSDFFSLSCLSKSFFLEAECLVWFHRRIGYRKYVIALVANAGGNKFSLVFGTEKKKPALVCSQGHSLLCAPLLLVLVLDWLIQFCLYFRGEELVAQATKSELLLPTPFEVTVMAVKSFRRFSFNSDHSCCNVEYSFLLFFYLKNEKKPPLCDADAHLISIPEAAHLPW